MATPFSQNPLAQSLVQQGQNVSQASSELSTYYSRLRDQVKGGNLGSLPATPSPKVLANQYKIPIGPTMPTVTPSPTTTKPQTTATQPQPASPVPPTQIQNISALLSNALKEAQTIQQGIQTLSGRGTQTQPPEAQSSFEPKEAPTDEFEAGRLARQTETQQRLMEAYKPFLNELDTSAQSELQQFDQQSEIRRQQYKNILASKGILGVAPEQTMDLMNEFEGDIASYRSAIQGKYNLQKQQTLGQISAEAYSAGNAYYDKLINDFQQKEQQRWEQFQSDREFTATEGQRLFERGQTEKEFDYQKEVDKIEQAFKERQITDQEKTSALQRLKLNKEINAPVEGEGEFKSQLAVQGRQAVSSMLKIAESNPGIFGRTAALPLPDSLRSDAFRNYEAQLDSLKGNIIPAALTAMREASKTGGALGQVSDREGAWLSASLGALSMTQHPETVKEQLKQIDTSLSRWQTAVDQYGDGQGSAGGTVIMTGPQGSFNVPADKVETFKQNGYTITQQ